MTSSSLDTISCSPKISSRFFKSLKLISSKKLCRFSNVSNRQRICTSSCVCNSTAGTTITSRASPTSLAAATFAIALWSATAMICNPLADDIAPIFTGVISLSAHGDNALWICKSYRIFVIIQRLKTPSPRRKYPGRFQKARLRFF